MKPLPFIDMEMVGAYSGAFFGDHSEEMTLTHHDPTSSCTVQYRHKNSYDVPTNFEQIQKCEWALTG